jgi:hypothetical protein
MAPRRYQNFTYFGDWVVKVICARPAMRADHRLVGRGGVGADHHHRLVQGRGGLAQLGGELLDAAERHRVAVHHVLPLRVHQDRHLVRPLELALGLRARQVDLQLGVLRVRGGDHQEDQDHQHHVDHRHQVDLERLLLLAALEVHAARSPCTMSTSLAARCSISTTKPSTLARKCR